MQGFLEQLTKARIIPVITCRDSKKAVPMAKALLSGGLTAAEITFRSEAAADCIRAIVKEVPEIYVCAGTILTAADARRAVEAGAKAVISPGTNPEVVEWCIRSQVPVLPGCATPSEVECSMAMGLSAVKLFPAELLGGVRMLKALSGPYPGVRFMPTGGISPENVRNYLACPNVLACGGSWITPEALLEAGDFAAIEKLAREAAALAK